MAEPTEIQQLRDRIAEVERQIVEEREEFQWDLKTRCESYERNIRRLEDENAQLKQASSVRQTELADIHRLRDDVEQYTHRALKAERRVAELQEEIKRLSVPVAPPLPRQDPVLRARAEEAEHERDRARQTLVKYENELKQVREELARQAEQGRDTVRIQEELQQQEKVISQLRREGIDKDQKLLEMSDRLQASATFESQYNALRCEVEQARARNLQLEQILVERGVSEQPEPGGEYQGILELNQPVVFEKQLSDAAAEHIDDAVVGVVAEPTNGDELLPVISPDELYPDEPAPPAPATQPEQAPVESLAPPAQPDDAARAVVRSELPAATEESAAPESPSPEMEGIAEAWLVTDEPRLSEKSGDQAASTARGHVAEVLPQPLPSQPVPRQVPKKPEPVESPRRGTKVGIFAVLTVVGVILGAGIAGIAYFYPDWFGRNDWIANVGSWISALKSESTKGAPIGATDASHAKADVTDRDTAAADKPEVPSEKPAASAPVANPVPDSQSPAASAEPVKESPPKESTGDTTAAPLPATAPEPDSAASGVAESPSMPQKPSAEQVDARERGFLFVNNKAWTQAENEISQSLKKFPDDPILRYLYGRVLVNKKEMPKAVAEFERAVELDSTMADAYWELGRIYTVLKKKSDAKAALESFIHLVPNDTQRTPQAKALIRKLR